MTKQFTKRTLQEIKQRDTAIFEHHLNLLQFKEQARRTLKLLHKDILDHADVDVDDNGVKVVHLSDNVWLEFKELLEKL